MGGHFLNLNPLVRQMVVNFYLKSKEGSGSWIVEIPIYLRVSLMIESFLLSDERNDRRLSKYSRMSGQEVVETTCCNINIYLFLQFVVRSCPIIPIILGPCKEQTRNLNGSTPFSHL